LQGISTQIERLMNALSYSCLEVGEMVDRKDEATFIKESLVAWRNTFRREKPRLEAERGLRMSGEATSLSDLNDIWGNASLKATLLANGNKAKAGEMLRMLTRVVSM
jgi:hypothetical protein